jgi:hypothetical protein
MKDLDRRFLRCNCGAIEMKQGGNNGHSGQYGQFRA